MGWLRAWLGMVVLVGSAMAQEEKPKGPSEREKLVAGITAFACDLYGELRKQEGNLFLSPFAVSTAGGMLTVGAAGKSEAELRKTFHFPERDTLLATWPKLRKRLGKAVGGGMTLRFANAACVEKTEPVTPAYQKTLADVFRLPWYPMDFRNDPDGSVRKINAWAARKTNQEGMDILRPGDIDREVTKLVLLNASYFKGTWADAFPQRSTRPRTFHLDGERETKVATMRREVEQRIADRELLTVVPLAYRSSSIEMVLLVPKEIDGLAKVEQELSAEKLTEWMVRDDGWRDVKLKLYLPKLAYESRFDLLAAISQLGVKDVLSTHTADLSPMFGPESLQVSDPPFLAMFVHASGIRVFEEGTVAWSKTAERIDWGGELPQKDLTIRADRPFLFLIRERKTGLVLYLGRVVDPSQQ